MERIDHILVVDDDRDIRELIVDYLEKTDIAPAAATNSTFKKPCGRYSKTIKLT